MQNNKEIPVGYLKLTPKLNISDFVKGNSMKV